MRDAYLHSLYDLAKKDERVVSLVADNGLIVYDDFRKDFPDRFYNFGISEGNMVSAAAGMASCGLIPFIYTISAFLAYRAYEFIRDDVCYQEQNVKIIGIGTGFTYSTLGPTHHTTEDIALLRSIPNLTVFSPATKAEALWVMEQAYKINGPVYVRLGNNKEEYYPDKIGFEIGVPAVVREGEDITVFTTGTIINEVVKAAQLLEADGISTKVVSVHTLKPLNSERIAKMIKRSKMIVTVEEHNVIGGLYTAIAEVMADSQAIVPCHKIGLDDVFACDYGTIENVRMANGIDSNSIYKKMKLVMQ